MAHQSNTLEDFRVEIWVSQSKQLASRDHDTMPQVEVPSYRNKDDDRGQMIAQEDRDLCHVGSRG